MSSYDPEAYWSRVAGEIRKRGESHVAGDDDPYYRYKRRKVLRRFVDAIDFRDKSVLELGPGPGGNLLHIARRHSPRRLLGADVSADMLEIARRTLRDHPEVDLHKIDGVSLPFGDAAVDLSFTVTVLQHNTDERMFRGLVRELCRVTRTSVIAMEDIGGSGAAGHGDWVGRRVDVYASAFRDAGFGLAGCDFLNTRVSRAWHGRLFRAYERWVAPGHAEGQPLGAGLKVALGLPLALTMLLDDVFAEHANLAKMVFLRSSRAE